MLAAAWIYDHENKHEENSKILTSDFMQSVLMKMNDVQQQPQT